MNNIIIYFFILFIVTQCPEPTHVVQLKNETFTIKNFVNYIEYIEFLSQIKYLPNFIKIILSNESSDKSNNYKYSISYYEDSTFLNRTQMSKLSNFPVLYLTKEQIENNFYLSIECHEDNCNKYNVTIYTQEFCEIEIGQKYTYYITEQNKKMKFVFTGESLINHTILKNSNHNNTIIIWAKGSKNINSKLEGGKYDKHSKYNVYIIKLEDIEDFKYYLEVEGTVGDLINVGSVFLNWDEHNICLNCEFSTEFENVGFLKKNINDEICYKVFDYKDNVHVIPIDNKDIEIPISKFWNKTNKYFCIHLPEKINELFFIFHNINNTVSFNQNYSHLYPGYNYHFSLEQGIAIGYLPMFIEENFNCFTYNIFTENINNNAYILTCDNYPFCIINEEKISKSIPLKNYLGFYSISLNKSELDIDISPISKIKKLLVFSCNSNNKENCEIYVNIYTDKTQIMLSEIPNQYKYIRKGNEENLLIKANNNIFKNKDEAFINIEILSGNISLITNSKIQHFEYKKIHLYKLNILESFSLQIKANENSVYSIKHYKANSKYEYINFIPFGGNYLLNIQNISYIILTKGFNSQYQDKNNQKYISFYQNNNNIKINYNSGNAILTYYNPNNKSNNIFYQDIFTEQEDRIHINTFNLHSITKNINPNLVYMSTNYIQNNKTEIFDNLVILQENIPRIFLFNSKYNENKFTYLFSPDNNEVNIYLNILNNGAYEIYLFVNNIKLDKKSYMKSNEKIKVEYNDWKDKCINEQQICDITFNIKWKNFEGDSYLEIYINKKDEEINDNEDINDEENNKKNKKKYKIFLVFIIISLCLSLIISGIFIIRGCRKNNLLVIEDVNKISFLEEK